MIFNSIEKHLYTIIILHGMFQTYKDLIYLKTGIQKHNKNMKVILPTAPLRTISWSDKPLHNISSWYDYYTQKNGLLEHDEINETHFTEQTQRVYKIIDNERKSIAAQNIIIAGISQGGTIAFNVGLHYKEQLGAIIGIHTIFLNTIIPIESIQTIPIYLFSGRKDSIYNIHLQESSLAKLNEKCPIDWHIEENLNHCEFSHNELNYIVSAIIRSLPLKPTQGMEFL